jgi:hypothetical protein
MAAVLFFVVIMMPGQQAPLFYMEPVANHEACMEAQQAFVQNPTRQLLLRSGQLQIGCTLTYEPSEEH